MNLKITQNLLHLGQYLTSNWPSCASLVHFVLLFYPQEFYKSGFSALRERQWVYFKRHQLLGKPMSHNWFALDTSSCVCRLILISILTLPLINPWLVVCRFIMRGSNFSWLIFIFFENDLDFTFVCQFLLRTKYYYWLILILVSEFYVGFDIDIDVDLDSIYIDIDMGIDLDIAIDKDWANCLSIDLRGNNLSWLISILSLILILI